MYLYFYTVTWYTGTLLHELAMTSVAASFDAIRKWERVGHNSNLRCILLIRVIHVGANLLRRIIELELDKKSSPTT